MNNAQIKTLGEKFIELSGMFLRFIERCIEESKIQANNAEDR